MLGGVFRLYSFREADGAKGSAGRKTLSSFCLNPIGSSRGQSMLVSEAFSCATERRTRRPVIEIFKLPVVSRIRLRWRPPVSVPYTSLPAGLRLDTFRMNLRHRLVRRIRDKTLKIAVRGWTSRCAKRPSRFQSDEACRSVIQHVGVSQSRCIANVRPPTFGPNCRLQCPLRDPDAKPTVDLQGRTVPLYLNHDRSGENNPQ